MHPIPEKLKRILGNDPYYRMCARMGDGKCAGRITWEHVIIYAGRQVQEFWAIIPLCEYHHGVGTYQNTGGLDKQINIFIALSRATEEDLKKYPKEDWEQMKKRAIYLIRKRYGTNTKILWLDVQRQCCV
jgi:hypothetical protein